MKMSFKYPANGLYVVQGEIITLMTSMKKFHWSQKSYMENENNPLLKNLVKLKDILNEKSDLREVKPNTFLAPFLDVIISVETSAQVTVLALAAVNKFISYGLIGGVDQNYLLLVIDNVADVISHTARSKVVLSDDLSENMVLMSIIEVLKTLVLSPLGPYLSNDSVCDIMLSCFRICFETRLNDLLRQSAVHCLKNIVQFLLTRLSLFVQTPLDASSSHKKMRMRSKNRGGNSRRRSSNTSIPQITNSGNQITVSEKENDSETVPCENQSPPNPEDNDFNENEKLSMDKNLSRVTNEENEDDVISDETEKTEKPKSTLEDVEDQNLSATIKEQEPVPDGSSLSAALDTPEENKQYVNSQGVRFMSDDPNLRDWLIAEHIPLEPHDSICVQELLRFLSSICNPHDKLQTDVARQISLMLLTIALETGADAITKHPAILTVIKDTLCRSLISIISSERTSIAIFTTTLHVSFLLFESIRSHLKFQMENFLSRLTEIIVSENPKIIYDKRELALETLVRLWRIPGFDTELYANYDCGLYCVNLYEEITKLLAKSANPIDGIYTTHLLALDALLITIESIEKHCPRLSSNRVTSEPSLVRDEERESHVKNVPFNLDQLMTAKRKKELLNAGTQHFNNGAKKGIQFLQEQELLAKPTDPVEVAKFLRENPHLDKKMIGDYICARSNTQILEQFVKSFDFQNLRIDQALRLFLQSFRLPGESGPMLVVMQHFADHWHDCNDSSLSRESISQLAFATVVLNTLVHNEKVIKNHPPMTLKVFKSSLRGENNGEDFDESLLESIYQSIKDEEIIMPAEHVGIVRENYLWEVLLRRGVTKDSIYISSIGGECNRELFALSWSPVVVALSYVFDKTTDFTICVKAIEGFRKCAKISAHYGMSNAVDFLTMSLCRFTTLTAPLENVESFTIMFATSTKARLAAETVFDLVHDGHDDILRKEWRPSDILRDGWRPVFDCIFQLFRCKLLPKILVEAEDFLELSGKISLIREDVPSQKNTETGLLSSLYSYITLSRDATSQRIFSDEEKELIQTAKDCVADYHLEDLIPESKDLRLESLHELLKVLIRACYNAENMIIVATKQEEDKAVFFLELLLRVVIQNKDRISSVWQTVCDHLHALLLAATSAERFFLMERCVIGLLRLAIRLMSRDEISSSVLRSLQIMLLLKWSAVHSVSRQISYGLYELMKTGAASIHSETDWAIIFTLFEVVGAGAPLPKFARTDGEDKILDDISTDCPTEDGRVVRDQQHFSGSEASSNLSPLSNSSCMNSYLLLNDFENCENSKLYYTCNDLLPHDSFSMVKCCESLAFLIRDGAFITPLNFKQCVHTMRTFVEATLYAGERKRSKSRPTSPTLNNRHGNNVSAKSRSSGIRNQNNAYDSDDSEIEEYPDTYFQIPLQLLDLIDTLHTKTAQIHKNWIKTNDEESASSALWPYGWRPLLQGIARLCCDPRKSVRMRAITYLQRALLMHDLQMLKASEWESCFNHVLFPLLELLAEPFEGKDYTGVEETRMRAATLLSKVFLHHLSPLQLLPSFTSLWLRILDFMKRYMNIDKNSDLLNEAIQESVKNMVLVMASAKLFSDDDGQSQFWTLTWEEVDKIAPNLKNELLRYHSVSHETSEYGVDSVGPMEPSSSDNSNQETNETLNRDPVESKLSENTFVPHSVPIFPHMGQLMSTPIGPPSGKSNEINRNEVIVENVGGFQTQMSSLISSSSPEFLATLPSFRTQPQPMIFTNKQVDERVQPVDISSYTQSTMHAAWPAVSSLSTSPVEANAVPYFIQRSSSADGTFTEKFNVTSEVTRTESVPMMSTPYATQYFQNARPAQVLENSSFGICGVAVPASNETTAKNGPQLPNTNIQTEVKSQPSVTSVQSQLQLSFPAYSTFTPTNTNDAAMLEQESARQFFLQNW